MKLRNGYWAAVLGWALSSGEIHADADQNLHIMNDAARQLTWEAWMGDSRANLLVKQETIITPVAVVFGYADNRVACEAIARALSQPRSLVGTFKCQPIF